LAARRGGSTSNNPALALPALVRACSLAIPGVDQPAYVVETNELWLLLEDLERLKTMGLTNSVVAISFSQQLQQPNQDRVHPAYQYWGQSNPNRVIPRKVSKEEMVVCVKNIFVGRIHNQTCPKALSVYRPTDVVSLHLDS
jgi:hypothetical protein